MYVFLKCLVHRWREVRLWIIGRRELVWLKVNLHQGSGWWVCLWILCFPVDDCVSVCLGWRSERGLFEMVALQKQRADQGRLKEKPSRRRLLMMNLQWCVFVKFSSSWKQQSTWDMWTVYELESLKVSRKCSVCGPQASLTGPLLFCTAGLKSPEGFLVAPSVNGPDAVLFSFKFLSTFYTISVSPLPVFFLVVSCPITLLSACPAPWTMSTPGIIYHLSE